MKKEDCIHVSASIPVGTGCANCGKSPRANSSIILASEATSNMTLFCSIKCLHELIEKRAKIKHLNNKLRDVNYLAQLGYD